MRRLKSKAANETSLKFSKPANGNEESMEIVKSSNFIFILIHQSVIFIKRNLANKQMTSKSLHWVDAWLKYFMVKSNYKINITKLYTILNIIFQGKFLAGSFLKLVQDILGFVGPLMLK